MPPASATLAVQLTVDELRDLLRREVEPLRLELERLRGASRGEVFVPYPEAARRLGISLRSVQQRVKDGRLSAEVVGGERMVRLPAGLAPR